MDNTIWKSTPQTNAVETDLTKIPFVFTTYMRALPPRGTKKQTLKLNGSKKRVIAIIILPIFPYRNWN